MFFFVFVFKVVFFLLADIIIYALFVLTVVLRFFPLFNAFRKKRTRTARTAPTILSC